VKQKEFTFSVDRSLHVPRAEEDVAVSSQDGKMIAEDLQRESISRETVELHIIQRKPIGERRLLEMKSINS